MRRLMPLLALAASGCAGVQSMTGGAGLGSRQFNTLMLAFLIVTGLAYLFVLLFLGGAFVRRRRENVGNFMRPLLIGWTAFILVGIALLTLLSCLDDRQSALAGTGQPPLKIEITANQWWWQVTYQDPMASRTLITANELHLPVGRPVEITLKASDVIHSFWVPGLAGKQDLIPGRTNHIRLLPRRIGLLRGQCAEFCGMQHAHMALDVIVESPARFAAWYAAQLRPASPPATALAQAGQAWFLSHQCVTCHSIAGTTAGGRTGPDLTHVASRRTIAAGTLPMNPGSLAGWIANPQGPKPGNHMPTIAMSGAELSAVVAYLGSLE